MNIFTCLSSSREGTPRLVAKVVATLYCFDYVAKDFAYVQASDETESSTEALGNIKRLFR